MISAFLYLKFAYNTADRTVLWRCLLLKGVPVKLHSLIEFLYADIRRRVRPYGDVSPEFTKRSGVRHACPVSSFIFHSVIEMVLQTALSSCKNGGIDVCSDRKQADHVLILNK